MRMRFSALQPVCSRPRRQFPHAYRRWRPRTSMHGCRSLRSRHSNISRSRTGTRPRFFRRWPRCKATFAPSSSVEASPRAKQASLSAAGSFYIIREAGEPSFERPKLILTCRPASFNEGFPVHCRARVGASGSPSDSNEEVLLDPNELCSLLQCE